ncbi:MAG: CcmD family protein [bacterium]
MSGNWVFVGAAFAVTWAVILGYLVHLHRTLARAQAQLDSAVAGRR